MASSRPVATSSPSNVQTLCTAKPSTTTVTSMNMVTPLLMVAVAVVLWGLRRVDLLLLFLVRYYLAQVRVEMPEGSAGFRALGAAEVTSGSCVVKTRRVETEKKRRERREARKTRTGVGLLCCANLAKKTLAPWPPAPSTAPAANGAAASPPAKAEPGGMDAGMGCAPHDNRAQASNQVSLGGHTARRACNLCAALLPY